ncbi:MAG: bifunctional adenosylcobinamide kinase/adenosylcobinamide-phosphate guanylyltransferase [Tissierellia bacterium]|nr:bifunctional adenosylcobinamide kinase/adenosylcobinamide-phosphate guanylyltransferase [Tissierellia bacterium]
MIRLVTGGARSGKSSYAEALLMDREDVLYIATAKVEDEEMAHRVKKHQARRPSQWGLYEGDQDLAGVIGPQYGAYLLDCVTVLASNYLFARSQGLDQVPPELLEEVEEAVFKELSALVKTAKKENKSLVLVTNEVGDGPVPMYSLTRAFRDLQGRTNQRLAALVDEVYLVVCGLPVKIK